MKASTSTSPSGTLGNIPGAHPLSVQIRVHHLNDDENLDAILFRVEKGWTIQFKLGTTLFGKKVQLFTNYPEAGQTFKRLEYRQMKWRSESINKGDDTALYSNLTFEISGSFHYFFIYEGSTAKKPNGSGYILVDPELKYGPDNEILPLDCILCQTYLAKCLGPFHEWEQRLQVGKESGYNMVHITPIQELGASLSSYSLRNQLKLNSMFSTRNKTYTMEDVARLIEKMKTEWKVLAITDVVLNHSANESEWLKEHPESTYNLINSPHLRPAYLLDRAIWYFSLEVARGNWAFSSIPPNVENEKHLEAIHSALHGVCLSQIKLYEMYLVNVDNLVKEFRKLLKEGRRPSPENPSGKDLVIVQDPEYRRFKSSVDMDIALEHFGNIGDVSDDHRINQCCDAFRRKLEELNGAVQHEVQIHLNAAVENVLKAVRYERLDPSGPRKNPVTAKHPLVPQYFYHPGSDLTLEDDEKLMYSDKACYVMAHNGWVMGDDPLRNFAEYPSNVYIRRELIAWGDSVKLRYGKKPEDSPYLWDHMSRYVQEMATTFHGLRLDNCHSTPIHVAEYLIDKAREVRPDLYVIAELFTSNEGIDNIFVNRLGITSLVREAMSAPIAYEQGRLVYRYGGSTVGAFMHPVVRPLTQSIAHAIFMDITHDNPCPIEKRSVYDGLPTAACVAMACCATGSTRGYDELVPHHIHVVDEKRFYPSWTDSPKPTAEFVNLRSGIIDGKRVINKLHHELGTGRFNQVFVDQRDDNTIAITRHCPATHQSVILIARTAFSPPSSPTETGFMKPLNIPGIIEEIIFEARLVPLDHLGTTLGPTYKKNERFINGLNDFQLEVKENIKVLASEMIQIIDALEDGSQEIDFINFPPGSVIAFRVSLDPAARSAILKIRTCLSQFGYRMRSYSGNILQRQGHDFESILSRLTLTDLNRVLFRCDAEEKDDGKGGGVYNIPNYGNLLYCGLQGIMSELMTIRLNNDLGHPVCDNLRQGDWFPSYVANRLLQHPSTNELGQWFQNVFRNLSVIPRYLIPCYFDSIITGAYSSLLSSTWRKMSEFVSDGSTFVKALALGSVILCGAVKSAPMPDLSPSVQPPMPVIHDKSTGETQQGCSTLAAGFPHFSVEYMRNWGRDTFISLRGMLLITGRHLEARYVILSYAGCLRHGLIPNLLDRGVKARFNCRDAIWWWLLSIQHYTKMVPEGHIILTDYVSRIFPTDDSEPQPAGSHDQPLYAVIQEALQRHFQGVKFRERNAGFQLDSQMTDNGFNNEIGVDLETGFVFGGNENNCGTWMDKMGSSEQAGNKGLPATPRDGSAVELVGLCKSALRWLNEMYSKGYYPYNSVEKHEDGRTTILSFAEWEKLIETNFERCFWVNTTPVADEYNAHLINKRGMYKDCFKASQPWTDFQLRPNFILAMAVAPELFTPQNAWTALEKAEKYLVGPLGMKTLDPDDWAYNGDYHNDDNSCNKNTARGFNYHQGPEWLWPMGYFLRAKLIFGYRYGGKEGLQKSINYVKQVISRHFKEIQNSKWKGLPELTNKNGSYCRDSCHIQAWSHASLLELLYDMDEMCSPEVISS